MRILRVVASNEEFRQGSIIFSKRNSRHLRLVLRRQRGDQIHVLYAGETYLVELGEYKGGTVHGKIIRKVDIAPASTLHISLAFSCIRPAPTEEILRHGTELGINEFFPVLAERSNRKPLQAKDRWRHIIESAVSQCGRIDAPTIQDPLALPDFLHAIPHPATRLVLSTEENSPSMLSALGNQLLDRVTILAGPEGGFADREKRLILEVGFQPASLGGNILRTETAALAAVSIVSAWRNWMAASTQMLSQTNR